MIWITCIFFRRGLYFSSGYLLVWSVIAVVIVRIVISSVII